MVVVQQITDVLSVSEAELFARIGSLRARHNKSGDELWVQLRDPQLSTREFFALGKKLRPITREVGAKLIVNDRLDVAILIEADGIHLGQKSVSIAKARSFLGEKAFISCSAHSLNELIEKGNEGANVALLSPIFASPGKGTPLGVSAICEARKIIETMGFSMKLLALGGVSMNNVRECVNAGADGVASIRADLTPLLWGRCARET